jgi:hypothetical protein
MKSFEVNNTDNSAMKDITVGTPASRHDVVYEVQFSAVELDLLYELARHASNGLADPEDMYEPGSWGASIIELDKKLTTIFRQRRR